MNQSGAHRRFRHWWFHWLANSAFAVVAGLPFLLGAGPDPLLVVISAFILGLLLVPVTRRWEQQRRKPPME